MTPWLRRSLLCLGMIALFGLLIVLGFDVLRYHLDNATCRSDNLYVSKVTLETFHDKFNRLPVDFQELRIYAAQDDRDFYLRCHNTDTHFDWRPSYAQPMSKQGQIILACPRASHGFLRKFAWAVAYDGAKFNFVKLRPDGAADSN